MKTVLVLASMVAGVPAQVPTHFVLEGLVGPEYAGEPQVYDSSRDRIVSFSFAGPAAVTYENDGASWQNVGLRPPIGQISTAYDEARRRIVVFAASPAPSTWEYDGRRWRPFDGAMPTARTGQMVYHRSRRTCMMFGGLPPNNELWEWNGAAWRQVVSPGAPPASINGLTAWYENLMYDESRDCLVVYGRHLEAPLPSNPPSFASITYEWDGHTWLNLSVGGPTADGLGVFDRARGVQVLIARRAADGLRQVWERSGSGTWTLAVAAAPAWLAPYYHSRRDCIHTTFNDYYRYQPIYPAAFDTIAPGCPGILGTPALELTEAWTGAWTGDTMSVTATGLPFATGAMMLGFSTTTAGGVPLPIDLSALGMPGCLLHVAPDRFAALSGTYGQAVHELAIPDDASLRGARFHLQAVSLDPWANAFGAALSAAHTVTIGWR